MLELGWLQVLVTASGCMRGRKVVPLKRIADGACDVAARSGVKVRYSTRVCNTLLCFADSVRKHVTGGCILYTCVVKVPEKVPETSAFEALH